MLIRKLTLMALAISGMLSPLSGETTTNQTNQLTVEYAPPETAWETNRPEGSFWQRYAWELRRSGNRRAINEVGDLTVITEMRELDREGYGFDRIWNARGQKSVIGSLGDSFRETLVNMPFIESLGETGQGIVDDILPRFITGSIGNTAEEHVNAASATPSYADMEYSWFPEIAKETPTYGVRPWRTRPYAYVESDIGHQPGGLPIMNLGLRCYSLIENSEIGLLKIEPRATVPLPMDCQITLGAAIYPTKLGSSDRSPSAAVRLEHVIIGKRNPGIISVGAESGPHRREMVVMVSMPWECLERVFRVF